MLEVELFFSLSRACLELEYQKKTTLIITVLLVGTYKSYALANPRAVVVKLLDAVIADGAMRGSWQAVPQAGLAKLHLHREAIHNGILGPHPRSSSAAPVHRWRVGSEKFISFRRRSCVPWH
jgi:hypothetical protein